MSATRYRSDSIILAAATAHAERLAQADDDQAKAQASAIRGAIVMAEAGLSKNNIYGDAEAVTALQLSWSEFDGEWR